MLRSGVLLRIVVVVAAAAAAREPLDINTATVDQLRALPGMGAVYAQRIVAGRPYTAKNQLVQRGILPPGAYEGIKDRIVAHRARAGAQH